MSQIEDTDYAAESVEFVQAQILTEASMISLGFLNNHRARVVIDLLEDIGKVEPKPQKSE